MKIAATNIRGDVYEALCQRMQSLLVLWITKNGPSLHDL